MLLLLPLRSMALRAAMRLAALAQRETRVDSIQGKQRLAEEYGRDEGEGEAGQRGRGGVAPDKPAEHAALFAGNTDDLPLWRQDHPVRASRGRADCTVASGGFAIARRGGLGCTKGEAVMLPPASGGSEGVCTPQAPEQHCEALCRGAVRLFAEFYQADVIIASPLGLATALSAADAEGAGGADFLSSIEVAVVD